MPDLNKKITLTKKRLPFWMQAQIMKGRTEKQLLEFMLADLKKEEYDK